MRALKTSKYQASGEMIRKSFLLFVILLKRKMTDKTEDLDAS